MGFWLTISFDPSAQGALDRLTEALTALNTTIGVKFMASLADIKASADNVAAVIATAVTEFGALAAAITANSAKITDLTAQLAAAVAANDPAQVQAISDELTVAAQNLKTAADAAATVLPAPAPAPVPPA